uniref:Uncharacterized protein n=1 Tax=Pseudodiaptomus poplesia TaxID=213370 RepID=A0A0U2VCM8_9MAXI|nr:hypothetical protein [Pseudodiaptomus poplesia]
MRSYTIVTFVVSIITSAQAKMYLIETVEGGHGPPIPPVEGGYRDSPPVELLPGAGDGSDYFVSGRDWGGRNSPPTFPIIANGR